MIQKLIHEINGCLDKGMHLAALMMAVTLPDACAKVEYPNIKGSKKRYLKWVYENMDKYEIDSNKKIDAIDLDSVDGSKEKFQGVFFDRFLLYNLRCNLLHEGNPESKHELVTDIKLYYEEGVFSGSVHFSYDNQIPISVRRSIIVNIYSLIQTICSCAEVSYSKNKESFDLNTSKIYLGYPGITLEKSSDK